MAGTSVLHQCQISAINDSIGLLSGQNNWGKSKENRENFEYFSRLNPNLPWYPYAHTIQSAAGPNPVQIDKSCPIQTDQNRPDPADGDLRDSGFHSTHPAEMTKHSKNNTASSIFSYAEYKKLDYGTKRQRLGNESMKSFNACSLCLERARNPVACSEGHLFCTECVLTDLGRSILCIFGFRG